MMLKTWLCSTAYLERLKRRVWNGKRVRHADRSMLQSCSRSLLSMSPRH
jgi:hypothetical protein